MDSSLYITPDGEYLVYYDAIKNEKCVCPINKEDAKELIESGEVKS